VQVGAQLDPSAQPHVVLAAAVVRAHSKFFVAAQVSLGRPMPMQ
jgi:hypothetical protein